MLIKISCGRENVEQLIMNTSVEGDEGKHENMHATTGSNR